MRERSPVRHVTKGYCMSTVIPQKISANVTRRFFLAAGLAAFSSLIISPSEGNALLSEDNAPTETLAYQMWKQAEEQALQEGATIETGELLEPNQDEENLRGAITSVATKYIYTAPLPNYLHVAAVYNVVSGSPNRISAVNNVYAYFTTGTVSNAYYSRTIIDGGRTLAVYCSGVVTVLSNINIGFDAYAEFYASGANYIS